MEMLKKYFAVHVYIKIRRNQVELKYVESDNTVFIAAERPFTSTRLLVGNFNSVVHCVKQGLSKLGLNGVFRPSPYIVIHPLEMVDGGLSQIEERSLLEIGYSVGAPKVFVHVGEVLSDAQVVDCLKK